MGIPIWGDLKDLEHKNVVVVASGADAPVG